MHHKSENIQNYKLEWSISRYSSNRIFSGHSSTDSWCRYQLSGYKNYPVCIDSTNCSLLTHSWAAYDSYFRLDLNAIQQILRRLLQRLEGVPKKPQWICNICRNVGTVERNQTCVRFSEVSHLYPNQIVITHRGRSSRKYQSRSHNLTKVPNFRY